MKKRKILVYWDYRRRDLLLPFDKLDNYFEWYFIFFSNKQNDLISLKHKKLYWNGYKTPYQLLRKIDPDNVIFSDLSSLYAISLNIACKNKGITTYLLDHGIKLNYNYYSNIENNKRETGSVQKRNSGRSNIEKIHTLIFYLSSLRFRNGANIIKALQLLFSVFRSTSDNTFSGIKFSLRSPDKYLLFSKQNFPYYNERDGASASNVFYIGNPHLDEYLLQLNTLSNECLNCPYYLLLDDGQVEVFGVTVAQKNNFIEKLNRFSLAKGARFIVKLHPFDYGRYDLYQHENITYLEAADLTSLMIKATGCFAISTTLMIPLIIEGKVIIFRLAESKIQDVLKQYGVSCLDFFNFDIADIDFKKFSLDKKRIPEFVDQFLYKKDGKAIERLKSILEGVI
jgi:hypothetical protein